MSQQVELVALAVKVEAIEKKTDRILLAVEGEGDRPGIKGRLQRIEDRDKTRSAIVWALFLEGLGIAGAVILLWFQKGSG